MLTFSAAVGTLILVENTIYGDDDPDLAYTVKK
jgi:hypothetical protein